LKFDLPEAFVMAETETGHYRFLSKPHCFQFTVSLVKIDRKGEFSSSGKASDM
jgi:hypothetical protein